LENTLFIIDGSGSYNDVLTAAVDTLFDFDLGVDPIKWDTDASTLTFQTDDYDYDGEIYNIRIKRESYESSDATNFANMDFIIEVRDRCWDAVLSPSVPASQAMTFDLWDPETWNFSAMSDNPPLVGTLSTCAD